VMARVPLCSTKQHGYNGLNKRNAALVQGQLRARIASPLVNGVPPW